jgi:hypothetical protein
MIKEWLTTTREWEEAMREIGVAMSHPGAFTMELSFLATGKVP